MRLRVTTDLSYAASQPCDVLLMIEPAQDAQQTCETAQLDLDPMSQHSVIAGEEGIGTRRWIKAGPAFECRYDATFDVSRTDPDWDHLTQCDWAQIPAEVVKYLMPSRYCHSDQFLDFVSRQFPDLTGGLLVAAMSTWITQNFTYDPATSHVGTTATDSFVSQRGVCRDYAHVLITFARAAGIPARFVSVYAPYVDPPDFHAVAEVYLNGGWHLIDPTGMARAAEMLRICVGRDAAEASFMTSYGWMDLKHQRVEVRDVTD